MDESLRRLIQRVQVIKHGAEISAEGVDLILNRARIVVKYYIVCRSKRVFNVCVAEVGTPENDEKRREESGLVPGIKGVHVRLASVYRTTQTPPGEMLDCRDREPR